jgi:putative ABC transport system substrate-binding protein
MRICLRRSEFVAVLGGAAVWPLTARAQQRAVPVVGYLSGKSQGIFGERLRMFLRGSSAFG